LPEEVSPFGKVSESNEEPEDKEEKMNHAKDELLRMHYKLGHMYFAKIRFMATMGWVETN